MEFTQDQRNTKFTQASDMQRYLYSDPDSGEMLKAIADTFPAVITDYKSFAVAIGDVILGLAPQEKLPDLLVERLQIPMEQARQITPDILEFLAPLGSTSEPAAVAQPVQINTTTDTLASEIAAAEAAMNTIQPMRTMSHDMESARTTTAEPVHSAVSQADILDQSATIKDKNPDATWGTAQ